MMIIWLVTSKNSDAKLSYDTWYYTFSSEEAADACAAACRKAGRKVGIVKTFCKDKWP